MQIISVLTSNDATKHSLLKENQGREFEIKDLGCLRQLIMFDTARYRKTYSKSQKKYVFT